MPVSISDLEGVRGMRGRSLIGATLALLACSLLLAACGSDSGGSSSSSQSTGQTKGAKSVDPASLKNAKGNITYCAGKDTSGDLKQGIADFNTKFKSQGLSAKLLEFPESADEQRNQFIQRERAKSADCDVFESDVIWTAEFAKQKWLMDMSKYVDTRKSEFIPSTLSSVDYDGKLWGVPRATDSATQMQNAT